MTRRDKAMYMLLIFTCVNNEDVHVRLICKNSKKKLLYIVTCIPQRLLT